MANTMICLDTSILIDFFRKTKKENTAFFKLSAQQNLFSVSVITEYEILTVATADQTPFWQAFFDKMVILPFDSQANHHAIAIYQDLKSKSKLIEIPDILIASTAINHQLPLATLNTKHFSRINNLILLEIN